MEPLTLPLEYAPRTKSIYSDLGFMLLAFILEDAGVGGHVDDGTKDGLLRDLQPALHGLASRRRSRLPEGRVRIPVPFSARAVLSGAMRHLVESPWRASRRSA